MISPARAAHSRQALHAWLLLTPALILLSLFAFIPSLTTFWSSLFSKGNRRNPSEYIGLENYTDLFQDPTFWLVLENNLIYAAVTIPVSIIVAFSMALWANTKMPCRSFVRASYFTPTILPMIAVANLWLFFYTPSIGIFDQFLDLFGIGSTNWLGQPDTVLGAVILVTIWKESGFFMIFYLAALQTIPPELKEAAQLEGASRWTYTRKIVIPLLMPTTLFILVNALINSVRLIDHLFILTKGGPNDASKLILYYIWELAFAYFDAPHAAALTILVLLVLAIIAALKFSFLDRRSHYQ